MKESKNSYSKEYKQAYMKKYWAEHKEKRREQQKRYNDAHPGYAKKYYEEHKEHMYEINRKWQKENKEKFAKLCGESRRRRVERLKAEGCTNPWSVVVHGLDPKYGDKNEHSR